MRSPYGPARAGREEGNHIHCVAAIDVNCLCETFASTMRDVLSECCVEENQGCDERELHIRQADECGVTGKIVQWEEETTAGLKSYNENSGKNRAVCCSALMLLLSQRAHQADGPTISSRRSLRLV